MNGNQINNIKVLGSRHNLWEAFIPISIWLLISDTLLRRETLRQFSYIDFRRCNSCRISPSLWKSFGMSEFLLKFYSDHNHSVSTIPDNGGVITTNAKDTRCYRCRNILLRAWVIVTRRGYQIFPCTYLIFKFSVYCGINKIVLGAVLHLSGLIFKNYLFHLLCFGCNVNLLIVMIPIYSFYFARIEAYLIHIFILNYISNKIWYIAMYLYTFFFYSFDA